MVSKSVSQLQKEIEDIEKKKKENKKKKELEEKLKRLKAPYQLSPGEKIQKKIRKALGKGVTGALDRGSDFFFE